jgi:hypothetical protein
MRAKLRPATKKNVGLQQPKKKWTPPPKEKGGGVSSRSSPSPMQTMFGNMGSRKQQQQQQRKCTAHRIPHLEPSSGCPIKIPKQDEDKQQQDETVGLAPIAVTGDFVLDQSMVIPIDSASALERQQQQENDDCDDGTTPTNQFKMQRAKLRSTRKRHPQVVSQLNGNDKQHEIISTSSSSSSCCCSTPYQEMRQKLKPALVASSPHQQEMDLVITATCVQKESEQQVANNNLRQRFLSPALSTQEDAEADVKQLSKDCHCFGVNDDDDDDDDSCCVVFLARFLPQMLLPRLRRKESVIV